MPPVHEFPDPDEADEDGLLAWGGDLHPQSLLLAYRQGIFPWPLGGPRGETLPLAWFSPPERGILIFSELHIGRSLRKIRDKNPYLLTIDRAFEQVIRGCADSPRPGRGGTWITAEMTRAYCEFHLLGHAHSVEAWEGDRLVGGVYGVAIDGFFAGESMFHLQPNASKLALLHLIDHLKSKGLDWIDIQMVTPHMEQLGARGISRDEFRAKLSAIRRKRLSLFP